MTSKSGSCLVVVADDFGKSSSVNRAVIEAHKRGIITSASIMAGGEALDEAIQLARNNPALSAGLHVTLCDGRAVLPRSAIPDLVDMHGRFVKSPSLAWIRYYRTELTSQITKEIEAQFGVLKNAGIRPTHVDSHHHIHMQPAVFEILCSVAAREGVPWIRAPREPLSPAHFHSRRGCMPVLEWLTFGILGVFHRKKAGHYRIGIADSVYGLSRSGYLDEDYLLSVLKPMRGITEVFSHPDDATLPGLREMQALTSPRIRERLTAQKITIAGYRELSTRETISEAGTRS